LSSGACAFNKGCSIHIANPIAALLEIDEFIITGVSEMLINPTPFFMIKK
jgi:hypothetical protein